MSYFGEIIHGTKTLLTGMKITGRYFFTNLFTRKDVITVEYPDNIDTLKMYDRFRGEVVMYHDENNQHRCDACTMCELACPNGSIEIIWDKEVDPESGKPKKVLVNHIYHLEMCTMCGLCIEACPSDAIMWGQGFHHSTQDRSNLTKSLNRPGSSIIPGFKKSKK
jgi:NADH-quinone oxidoreductase subunit I